MRPLTLGLLSALTAAGCSLVLEPNRNAIVRPMDSGLDAGIDAGDAGPDGDVDPPDAGCVSAFEAVEVSCNDGEDNDCDGRIDCADPRCQTDGYCCDVGSGGGWAALETDYDVWNRYGTARVTMDDRIRFGSGTGQLVHPTCAPLAYGIQLTTNFELTGLGNPGDYASLVLAPVNMPRGDGTLTSDLALRVTQDGTARLERAGSVLGEGGPIAAGEPQLALLTLAPGVDQAGRPVLLVSAEVGGIVLAQQEILMPLADLIDESGGCTPDGLYLAFDGRGSGVDVVVTSDVRAVVGNCDNPTQFLEDSAGPLGEDRILADGMWRAGGAGEPALLVSGEATPRIDLLVDAAEQERANEVWRAVDYTIGGAVYTGASRWRPRERPPSAPELTDPSSREPTYAEGQIAFAERVSTRPERYRISIASLGPALDDAIGTVRPVIDPADLDDCVSVRDPMLVSLDGRLETTGMLLFFTCEAGTDRLGVARVVQADGVFGMLEVDTHLLTSAIGAYAARGVSSPEVVATPLEGGEHALRIWFLARDPAGRATVAFAYGEVAAGELPKVSPYPGNPLLDPEDPILGGDCSAGCTIESFGVMATEGPSPLWAPPIPPSYVFLIERTRSRADGPPEHQLIPLRQPRPSDG